MNRFTSVMMIATLLHVLSCTNCSITLCFLWLLYECMQEHIMRVLIPRKEQTHLINTGTLQMMDVLL